MRVVIAIVLLFVGQAAFAQEGQTAEEHFRHAQTAFEAGDYDRAILESERSWRLEERPETLALRVRVLEAMEEWRLALDIIEQNRALLAGQSDVFLVEERLRAHLRAQHVDPTPLKASPSARTTFDTVGPIALGAAAAGLGVWSAWLLWPGECTARLPSGACQEEDEASVGGGIGVGVAALGAMTGAIVWWMAGAPASDTAWSRDGAAEEGK